MTTASDSEPSATDLPDREALVEDLHRAGVAIDPSELHGSLCGYLAGGGHVDGENWLQQLALETEVATAASGALEQLREATLRQLAAQDFDFQLLLSDDEVSLAERADGLIAWCNGFLGGIGLAAPAADSLSDEATEALQDIGRIAASDLAYDGSEADEDALAEIIEFVRVAALLLHGDCALGAHRKRQLH